MSKIIVIDFETSDPYIDRKLGSGWVYKYKQVPNCDFKLLCCAYMTHDGTCGVTSDWDELIGLVRNHDIVMGHNLQYDFGCLRTLTNEFIDKPLLDTEILGRLFNSALMSHSLDFLSTKYLHKKKLNKSLEDAVWDADLYPYTKKEIAEKKKCEKSGVEWERVRPRETLLSSWCKKNMEVIWKFAPKIVEEYAVQDVKLCRQLYDYFLSNCTYNISKQARWWSDLIHVVMDYRIRGVKVDLKAARSAIKTMRPIILDGLRKVTEICGKEINIRSSKELPEIFDALGIQYPKTDKGNPSITKDFLETHGHPICQVIRNTRKAINIVSTFIRKILVMQEYTLGIPLEDVDKLEYGRVHPEYNILRAKTGRFSCQGPNIQQIPIRDEVLGPICRALFIPENDAKWHSLDFSNQEGRIQIHYAAKLKCPGSAAWVQRFQENPRLDQHQITADMAAIDRTSAKTIKLGLDYGMGGAKLCDTLNLPTGKWVPPGKETAVRVAGIEGRTLINKYKDACPYLTCMQQKCQEAVKARGYIKTLLGRHIARDYYLWNGKIRFVDYKAMNQLIQGSAADQTAAVMKKAYEEKIPVSIVVHDEVNFSGTVKQAEQLKEIMETVIKLEVPCLTDIGSGPSWAEAH